MHQEPSYISLPTNIVDEVTTRGGKTFEVRRWVTFDVTQITSFIPTGDGTHLKLRSGEEYTVITGDMELKYILGKKVGARFVGYDYKSERDKAQAFSKIVGLQGTDGMEEADK